jgi:hypothetical protein
VLADPEVALSIGGVVCKTSRGVSLEARASPVCEHPPELDTRGLRAFANLLPSGRDSLEIEVSISAHALRAPTSIDLVANDGRVRASLVSRDHVLRQHGSKPRRLLG